jgi:hypothetical protein
LIVAQKSYGRAILTIGELRSKKTSTQDDQYAVSGEIEKLVIPPIVGTRHVLITGGDHKVGFHPH